MQWEMFATEVENIRKQDEQKPTDGYDRLSGEASSETLGGYIPNF